MTDQDPSSPKRTTLKEKLANHRPLWGRQNLVGLRLGTKSLPRVSCLVAIGSRPTANATVIYKRLPRLFSELQLAHDDGRFPRMFRQLVKADLLILDDWGPERMTAPQRRDLMEIIEDRYGSGATLVTSQLPVDAWHDIIDEPTFAEGRLPGRRIAATGFPVSASKIRIGWKQWSPAWVLNSESCWAP